MIHKDQRVLCVCRNGQVRSVAARRILATRFGFAKVIACGWELNDEATLKDMCDWANVVIVVGRATEWNLPTPPGKTVLIDIGPDIWNDCLDEDLFALLLPRLERIVLPMLVTL